MAALELNISLPTSDQWKKVATALGFSFVSTFLSIFTAGGGIHSTPEATITLIGASFVAGVNAALYALYITFFKKGDK